MPVRTAREILDARDEIPPLASRVPASWTEAAVDQLSNRREAHIDVIASGKTFDCEDAARHVKAIDSILEVVGKVAKRGKTRRRAAEAPSEISPRARHGVDVACAELARVLTPPGWRDAGGIFEVFDTKREDALAAYFDDPTNEKLAAYQEAHWFIQRLVAIEHDGQAAEKRLLMTPLVKGALWQANSSLSSS